MKCHAKGPLSEAEKQHILAEAERLMEIENHRNLTPAERERIIQNAQRERDLCKEAMYDFSNPDMLKKFMILFGMVLALFLAYYLYRYIQSRYVPAQPVTAASVEVQKTLVEDVRKDIGKISEMK